MAQTKLKYQKHEKINNNMLGIKSQVQTVHLNGHIPLHYLHINCGKYTVIIEVLN